MTMKDRVLGRLVAEVEEKLYWKELAIQRLSAMKTLQQDLTEAEMDLAATRSDVGKISSQAESWRMSWFDTRKHEQEALEKLHALVDAAAEIMPFVSARAGDRKAKLAIATTEAIDFHGRELPF